MVIDGDHPYSQKREDMLQIIADFQIIISKTGKVFYDDTVDLFCIIFKKKTITSDINPTQKSIAHLEIFFSYINTSSPFFYHIVVKKHRLVLSNGVFLLCSKDKKFLPFHISTLSLSFQNSVDSKQYSLVTSEP